MAATLGLAAYVGVPQPFRLFRTGGVLTFLRSTASGAVVWTDGTSNPVGANLLVSYQDGTQTVSNNEFVYVLVATKAGNGSAPTLALYLESDVINLPTLVGSGTYAIVFRVTDRCEYFQQV